MIQGRKQFYRMYRDTLSAAICLYPTRKSPAARPGAPDCISRLRFGRTSRSPRFLQNCQFSPACARGASSGDWFEGTSGDSSYAYAATVAKLGLKWQQDLFDLHLEAQNTAF